MGTRFSLHWVASRETFNKFCYPPTERSNTKPTSSRRQSAIICSAHCKPTSSSLEAPRRAASVESSTQQMTRSQSMRVRVPMREVQALHEWVQSALESDRSLQPEDVVVMTPDLDTYAPAFRAVFGQDDLHRIPYEVHDRSTRDDAAFYDDFQTILELLDSRFSVLDFVRLLDAGALRATFRFTQEERARLAELLAASGIRWGIDAAHREALEFPADPLHTWRAGLGRLFLGFASTPDDTSPFEGSSAARCSESQRRRAAGPAFTVVRGPIRLPSSQPRAAQHRRLDSRARTLLRPALRGG